MKAWVRAIWVGLWFAKPFRKPAETTCNMPQPRDYEWTEYHFCEVCRERRKHHFVEWMPERVVTARCFGCGFEGTLS
jgi:hypothetical protein